MSHRRSAHVSTQGVEPRRLAIEAVRRVDEEGAYANLLVPRLLDASDLDERDRNLVTELVYGSTRMRRSVDWLVDRFLVSPPPPALRAALRVGAYQLAFMRVPDHAAVSATVSASAKRNRGPVNAILRRVAESLPAEWPSDGIRLSYPDWIIDVLRDDLGADDALAMLEVMNTAPSVTERDDGYVQDPASSWVVDIVGAAEGERVLDLCAAPGGKATALEALGAGVVACDLRPARSGLVAANAARLGATRLQVVTADGTAPPFVDASFDRVLVDAPCSGLGVLRRRPDARWRIQASDVATLAGVQGGLLDAAAALVRPGGTLVYSVCTVTRAETLGVAEAFDARHDHAQPFEIPTAGLWRRWGTGVQVLPQDHDSDAMTVFGWRMT